MKIVVRVRVETPVRPTEDLAKVKIACLNVFPDLSFVEEGDRLVGEATTLDRFRNLVRDQKIRDTARAVLERGRRGHATAFRLSKQAAYVGRVNFATPSPLGALSVTVEDDDLTAVIEGISERGVGRPVTGTLDRTAGR